MRSCGSIELPALGGVDVTASSCLKATITSAAVDEARKAAKIMASPPIASWRTSGAREEAEEAEAAARGAAAVARGAGAAEGADAVGADAAAAA